MQGAGGGQPRDGHGMARAHRPRLVEIRTALTGPNFEPMLEVLTDMAAGKGDRGTRQIRIRCGVVGSKER